MKQTIEKLRKSVFWTIDLIKGRKIRKHYNDIKSILENYDSKESKDIRALHLTRLLENACSTTAFYKDYSGFSSLNDFPVINKTIIREKINEIQSETYRSKKIIKCPPVGPLAHPLPPYRIKTKD